MQITGDLGRRLSVQKDSTSLKHVALRVIPAPREDLDNSIWVYLDELQVKQLIATLQKLNKGLVK